MADWAITTCGSAIVPMLRIFIIVVFLLVARGATALDYRVSVVADGLDHPWSLAQLPDGSLLVTERAGRLRVIEQGRLRAEAVAGVPAVLAEKARAGCSRSCPTATSHRTARCTCRSRPALAPRTAPA